jgi:hypothetical protein
MDKASARCLDTSEGDSSELYLWIYLDYTWRFTIWKTSRRFVSYKGLQIGLWESGLQMDEALPRQRLGNGELDGLYPGLHWELICGAI